jgi:hypothetical protein
LLDCSIDGSDGDDDSNGNGDGTNANGAMIVWNANDANISSHSV